MNIVLSFSQSWVDLQSPRQAGLTHVFGCWVPGQEHRKREKRARGVGVGWELLKKS